MKRIFSMVLALAMVLSLGVFPVIAETATTSVTAPTPTAPILPEYTGTKSSITFTDTYNDCILMTVKGTNEEAFNAYLTTLTSGGYTQVVAPRAVLGTANKASIYTKGTDYLVNALWDATDKEAKITIEPLKGLDLSVFDPNSATTGNVTPLLIQVGLDGYVETVNGAGTHDAMDDKAEDKENKHNSGGMSYIYRLSDGRFVIYDGGGDGSGSGTWDKLHAARIYKTLEKYNATENGGAGEDITIAAWYITHPHTDHMGGFMAFTKYYVGVSVKLEKVICYLFNVETQTEAAPEGQSQSVDSGKIEAYNARLKELTAQGVDVYKAHVGQMYYIGNLTIEILFTYDLLSPTLPKAVTGNNVNGADAVTGYTETVMNRAEVSFTVTKGGDDDQKYKAFEKYAERNGYSSITRTVSETTVTYTYGENTISVTLNSKQDHWLKTYGQTNIGRKRIENSTDTITYRAYSRNDFTNAFSVISQATLKVENTSYKAIWTGDSTYYGIEKVNELYGEAMKSDFVQVPHHGSTQMARDESAATDELKYYHERQVDLFYGDNTTKTQIGTTGHYNSLYDADGYGYVRAKYVLWPSSLKNTAGYIDGEPGDDTASWDLPSDKKNEPNDSRRTTWHPNNHLQEEAQAAGGDVYVARNYLTVFEFGTSVSVKTDPLVITADIELPATTDGEYTLVYGSDDFKSMTASGKYKLAKDITVVNPTGSLCAKTFTGTLDGDGHTIKVAYTDNGATAFTGSDGFVFDGLNGATVQNLTVDGAKIVNNTSGNGFNIGFLAQRVLSTTTTTIDNVHIVNATFTDNATQQKGNIGGLIGDLATGAVNVTIRNSSFNGTVTTTSTQETYVGGILGRAGNGTVGAAVVNIENCTVSGSLSHTYAGGFVGQAKTTGTLAIKNSTNNATVTATTAAGGFVGSVTATGIVAVQSSINNGVMTAKYSGAMIAYLPTKATVKVTDSINNGTLNNPTGVTGVASGIAIGFIPSSGSGYESTITIENCVDFVSSGLGWWRKANAATMTNTPVEKGLTIVSGVTYDDTYFKMTDGVDYVGTEADPTGLRFDVDVNAALITALQNKGYTVTLGALVSTENNVQKAGYVFTVDALATLSTGASGYRVEEIANGDIANFLNGSDSYAITLPDLQNTTREYNAVGFMKITKNSVSTTIYAQYDPAEAKSLSGIQ